MSKVFCYVDFKEPYVQERIVGALKKFLPGYETLETAAITDKNSKILQWAEYEELDFEGALRNPNILLSSFCIRKALVFQKKIY